jgi:acyl dehydratase
MAVSKLEINQQIPSVTKRVTQETINQFEACGILNRESIHTNPDIAKQRLGYSHPIASGRLSVAFATESLRKFFGPDIFNHTGTVNLKFLRPVKHGDTVTVHGSVGHQERIDAGTLVTVDLYCDNQNLEKTAIGTGTAVVP